LKDEGGIPSPEADKKREQVIRKLNKVIKLQYCGARRDRISYLIRAALHRL
jgi:hypothetical protein